jgi:chitinase
VLLSIGGAAGVYTFSSEAQGAAYADTIWKMFMAGSDPSIPRPFGDAIVDGVDLDVEAGSNVGWTSLVKQLRVNFDKDPVRTYYIGAAPQCPFPDV